MTQRTKTALQTNLNADLADNTTGDISAADVRNNLIDFTDSVPFLSTADNALSGSFSGSFQGDGSGLTGISGGSPGSTKEYGYYNMTTQIGFSTNAYVTTGINTTPSTLSSTFSVSYDNSTGTFSGFTSGKLYELEFTWLTRAASGNSMRFRWEKDGVLIGNNSISDQATSAEARDQNTAKAAFISDGTEDIKIKCTGATGNAPLGFNGDYSFITIKEI